MLLIAVASVIIAIGRGYRVDTIKGTLTSTGILLATSDPDAAQVLVDGKFSGATNSNITLEPNWYEVTIRKEGYQEWMKKMRIQGEVVSKTDSTLFLTNPSLSPLTSVNVASPMLSPDGTKIAYMATPSMELKNGSELSVKLAAIPILYLLDLTSRPLPFDKNPKPYEGTLDQLLAEWKADERLLYETAMRKLPSAFLAIATSSSNIISFSPDDTKVLYEATASATLNRVINPAFNGTSPTEDMRNLKTGTIYVYDVKEDRNYELKNFQFSSASRRINFQSIQWLGTSKHLVLIENGAGVSRKISVMEYDGTNKITVYSGPFEDNYVFPHPSGRQLIILTTLNPEANPSYSLYTLNLR